MHVIRIIAVRVRWCPQMHSFNSWLASYDDDQCPLHVLLSSAAFLTCVCKESGLLAKTSSHVCVSSSSNPNPPLIVTPLQPPNPSPHLSAPHTNPLIRGDHPSVRMGSEWSGTKKFDSIIGLSLVVQPVVARRTGFFAIGVSSEAAWARTS